MSIFEYLIAAVMLVLGLGITQLLGDVVDAFRRRQSYRLHWIPMCWAGLIFAWQMQFIWAVFELQSLNRSWSAGEFLIMLSLALLLFVAGSLIVPKATDEAEDALTQFQQDGRWALAVLIAFFVLAYFTSQSEWDRFFLSRPRDRRVDCSPNFSVVAFTPASPQ